MQDIYSTATDRIDAMVMMDKWYKWAIRCRIEPVKEFAKTIKNNWAGVLNYFDSRLTNAILEGINSIIQAVRARAKGYRNTRNFITMIYLMQRVGIDETSSKRGHNYVTLFVDMDAARVVYVTEGKDSETVTEFKDELPYHNCNPHQINTISSDMSPAFKKGFEENFPWADVTFDKFHVMKLMNEAVDKVRRVEQKIVPAICTCNSPSSLSNSTFSTYNGSCIINAAKNRLS